MTIMTTLHFRVFVKFQAQLLAFSRMASMMPGVLNTVVSSAQSWPPTEPMAIQATSEDADKACDELDQECPLDLRIVQTPTAATNASASHNIKLENDDSDGCTFEAEPSTSFCAAADTSQLYSGGLNSTSDLGESNFILSTCLNVLSSCILYECKRFENG